MCCFSFSCVLKVKVLALLRLICAQFILRELKWRVQMRRRPIAGLSFVLVAMWLRALFTRSSLLANSSALRQE